RGPDGEALHARCVARAGGLARPAVDPAGASSAAPGDRAGDHCGCGRGPGEPAGAQRAPARGGTPLTDARARGTATVKTLDKPAQPVLLALVFAVVCVVSALALVYTKHESRKLFIELERLTAVRDELNIEWGRLQIEQSTWATHARIEQVAT